MPGKEDLPLDWQTLATEIQGSLYLKSLHPREFVAYASAFNASVGSAQVKAVALPRSTEDIAILLKFARRNSISVSVKGGGYATAGWAVRGELIISLTLLDSITIQLPKDAGHPSSVKPENTQNNKRPAAEIERTNSSGSNSSASTSSLFTPTGSNDSLNADQNANSNYQPKRARKDEGRPMILESVASIRQDAPVILQPTVDNPLVHQLELANQSHLHSLSDAGRQSFTTLPGTFQTPPLQITNLDGERQSRVRYFPTSPKSSKVELPPMPTPIATDGNVQLAGPTLPGPLNGNTRKPPRPRPPHARVTLGMGLSTTQIDTFTAQYGYHIPLGAFPVGCGQFVSGGFGFLSRVYGLAMDNVIEAEIVAADGRILKLLDIEGEEYADLDAEAKKEQEDLWWAFRGAGSMLGLVSKITARAYPVTRVYAADMIFQFNPATAPKLVKHWRDCLKNGSNRFYSALILTAGPSPSSHVIVITVCCLEKGTPSSQGSQFVESIASWPGEPALLKTTELRPFVEQQQSFVKLLSADENARWSVRSDLVSDLTDDCIEESCRRFMKQHDKSAWLFESAGGEIATTVRNEESCYPASCRSGNFQVVAIHQWRDARIDALCGQQAWQWINEVVSPMTTGGPFPSFFEQDEPSERLISAFGGQLNWDRLLSIKKRYDPDNVFRWTFLSKALADTELMRLNDR